ncbi:M13 family metallopeptidase [Sulfitobacter sp. D35]|uniref:M13 family metallopeptidase n=1 Tax=Sulfitobacter sp. D35 TaxID=3083252 RepID=UPI00296FADAC|nr:M13 family metallopeptidase [Sulfitobacter sp. D35]MDW4499267.1 M13 family metallopeptidase [Sulfitobacter sp. D35]
MNYFRRTSTAAVCALFTGSAAAQDSALPEIGPDLLAFSVENMDPTVDPAQDFYRYASGGWLDRVARPAQFGSYGIFTIMTDRLAKQVSLVAAEAGEAAAEAPKGSPTQLVGDFYNAFMDVEAIDAAGIEPIRPLLDEVAAVEDFADLTAVMARQLSVDGPALFAMFGPSQDPADRNSHAMFALGQTFGLDRHFQEVLRGPADSAPLVAYRTFIRDLLAAAGYPEAEAERVADLSLALERRLYAAFLTPAEAKDPANRFGRASYDEVKTLAPEIDLDAYLEISGFDAPDWFYLYEPRALPEVSEVWRDTPMQDLKDYAAFRIIENFAPFLATALHEPRMAFHEALLGARHDPPRSERVYDLLKKNLGHPASQLYVDRFYPEETRAEVLDLVERFKAVFRDRIEDSAWLSEPTREAALEKVDRFYYKVGYPDTWIDYSGVDIGSDPVANMIALGRFDHARELDKLTRPPEHDEFSGESTLPIAMNAAYSPTINGFEITAAITQPPAFSPDMDAPLKFCRLGAIIGHEMTHGFDFTGRQYDAEGNLRDWWTPEDTQAFIVEARKLVEQADAYEVLPGIYINGQLGVGENMADVGGITFAHEALLRYLDEHPEENVEIDGLNPSERCFIAWAQLWTAQITDAFLTTIVVNDGHAPDFYRAVAALQHVDAWYETFDIREGDPMWLAPENRSRAW